MFEQYADYFWIALFGGLVFYGLWQTISAPLLIKRFYKTSAFSNQGKSTLTAPPYDQSLLLEKLNAGNVYRGMYQGQRVEQFAAFPESRYTFTFSRVKRKRNQVMWTISVLHLDEPLVAFCARPTTVTDAIEYVMNRDNVLFPDDEPFANRVHVLADDHALTRKSLSDSIRQYLNNIDPVSLESVGKLLILKAPRQPHDAGTRLKSELDALLDIHRSLSQN